MDSCRQDSFGNYLRGWGAHAYLITQAGARKSLEAMKCITLALDVQWMLHFKKCTMFYTGYSPEKNIEAKVLPLALIEHSPLAELSTMTQTGDKPWNDGRYKGGFNT
jgi:hypothetical protein